MPGTGSAIGVTGTAPQPPCKTVNIYFVESVYNGYQHGLTISFTYLFRTLVADAIIFDGEKRVL